VTHVNREGGLPDFPAEGTQIRLICARPHLWPARRHGRGAVLVLFGATSQAKTAGLFSDSTPAASASRSGPEPGITPTCHKSHPDSGRHGHNPPRLTS
jgi:hypothetical protein